MDAPMHPAITAKLAQMGTWYRSAINIFAPTKTSTAARPTFR